jgi:hypothetical protein
MLIGCSCKVHISLEVFLITCILNKFGLASLEQNGILVVLKILQKSIHEMQKQNIKAAVIQAYEGK